ncbi:IncP-type conjugal transfer protein TrbI [Pleomorphomonas koreensis]|uniref:IncP-type conjugal transfer protein TrbI n=1 Tax=Pleomorphomonas koreensis TaxID=257440 RepID=UPI0003FFF7CC|nr:IncP-type conjugal transfer protein TrbI [Pleomorphomonas koreensis]
MVQSLKLGGSGQGRSDNQKPGAGIRRLNRLPVIIAIALAVAFFAVVLFGLTSRGLVFRDRGDQNANGGLPASTFADQMKRGVTDGIIGEPQPPTVSAAASANDPHEAKPNPFRSETKQAEDPTRQNELESEAAWRARLMREQQEQIFREQQRQRMARLQAANVALDSPLAVSTDKLKAAVTDPGQTNAGGQAALSGRTAASSAADLYGTALQAGLNGQNADPNGQRNKEVFFNSDLAKLGYLPNQVVAQQSPYELKRGSVIPATLITGINSDLPGRITAQVSQNVYDSATGYRLLIPQGTRLMGRYDSKVAFGQSRVLVVWTDIIFPNGSTLQIGGMAGTDAEGYGGFNDQLDNHYFKTFGSAVLLALIGTGVDMAVPENSTLANQTTASDAVRRNFAETFGRVTERTISKNLDIQPTIAIRPGFRFNVLVDQDIVFPGESTN